MKNAIHVAAGLIVGISMLIGRAEAKPKLNPVVEASIPFTFHLGNRMLPAGNYKFELATGAPNSEDNIGVLVVRNREAGIYQAMAVTVRPGAELEEVSKVVFSDGDHHLLVTVWEQGNRLDLQPAAITAANFDGRSSTPQLVSIVSRPIGQ